MSADNQRVMDRAPEQHSSRALFIYYPTRRIGGAQLLFVRIAQILRSHYGWTIHVVDIPDGFISGELTRLNVAFALHVASVSTKVDASGGVVLMAFTDAARNLAQFLTTSETRVLMWAIHPHQVLAYFRFGFFYHRLSKSIRSAIVGLLEARQRRRVSDLIDMAESKGGLVYMDGPNIRFSESLGIKRLRAPLFLPIPIQVSETRVERQWLKAEISVAWIGRLDDEKWPAVLVSIDLLSLIAKQVGLVIRYHIIGEGAHLEEARKLQRSGIEFVVAGRVSGPELRTYLLRGCRLGFAMGTSALEFGALGIPVLVVDAAKRVVPLSKVRLRWLHEIEEYDLGNFVGEENVATPRRFLLCQVLISQDLNNQYGERCWDYVKRRHNMSVVAGRLNKILDHSVLTLDDLRELLAVTPSPIGPFLHRLRNWIAWT